MKNTLKKIFKFISSRVLYLLIGLFLALAIFGVQAAWNSTVSSGQPLTSTLWNDVVGKLIDLDNEISTLNLVCTYREFAVGVSGTQKCAEYGEQCVAGWHMFNAYYDGFHGCDKVYASTPGGDLSAFKVRCCKIE